MYRSVEDIDLFVGGMAEDAAEGALLGPLFQCLLAEQFTRLKYADRHFYNHDGSMFTDGEFPASGDGLGCAGVTQCAVQIQNRKIDRNMPCCLSSNSGMCGLVRAKFSVCVMLFTKRLVISSYIEEVSHVAQCCQDFSACVPCFQPSWMLSTP